MQRFFQAVISAAILAGGLAAAPAMSQGAAPAQTPPQSAIQPSDAQLQKFAGTSQKVAMVIEEYRPKVQAAPDDGARQQLMKEADEKMVRAVNAEGMTVDEFNGIGQAIQKDPKLRQRVANLVQQQQGGKPQ